MKLVVKPDIIATKRTLPLQTEAYPLLGILVNFSSGTTMLVDQHSSALMRIFFLTSRY